jgi:RNA polymerase sigma-70 factor (ECF subfamily)
MNRERAASVEQVVAARETHGDPTRLADEELLALVAQGDDRAFSVLYDRHARVAYSLAFRLLGEREGAEDLVQDAFLAVWRVASTYSPTRGSVRTWLLAILHNRGIDRLRTAAAMTRRQEALERQERGARQAPDAAEVAVARSEAKDVRSALRDLPAEQLQVLQLAYYGGFTHQEIAEMLALPLGTVKSRMHLGLARIRRRLSEPGLARA